MEQDSNALDRTRYLPLVITSSLTGRSVMSFPDRPVGPPTQSAGCCIPSAAFDHATVNKDKKPIIEASLHSNERSKAPTSAATRPITQKVNDQRSPVTAKTKNAGLDMMRISLFRRLDVNGNLVDSLTAQVKFVGNLLERLSSAAGGQNLAISRKISAGAGLQWAPNPTGNLIECLDPIHWQLVFPLPLTNVANPCPKPNFLTESTPINLENLNVGGRDFAVAISQPELVECFDVSDESVTVVHVSNYIQERTAKPPRQQKVALVVYGGGKQHNG